MEKDLDWLLSEVRRLRAAGRLPSRPTRDETIDWAYGNTVLSNPSVTREMVEQAYDELKSRGALKNVGDDAFFDASVALRKPTEAS